MHRKQCRVPLQVHRVHRERLVLPLLLCPQRSCKCSPAAADPLLGPQAAGLALAGLVAGTFLGAAVQSWLRVDIIPLGVSAPCLHALAVLPESASSARCLHALLRECRHPYLHDLCACCRLAEPPCPCLAAWCCC